MSDRSTGGSGGSGTSSPRVVVVGGGVIGVTTAYTLARAGARVVLVERGDLAAGASYGNAGTISAGHPPLNKPGRVRKALSQMLDATSPLYIKPRWDPSLWRWLAEFAAACTPDRVAYSMRVMGPLGLEALELFDRMVEEEGLDCGYRREGYYAICRTQEGLDDIRHEVELMRPMGFRPRLLDDAELREVEPALKPGLAGGAYFPEAASCNPLRFVQEVADRVRRLGGEIRPGVEVTRVDVRAGAARGVGLPDGSLLEGDAVVLCTGPFSLSLARSLGLRLPVAPGKGYHRDLDPAAGGTPPLRISCVLHERSVFCTPMDGYVRYAGTMEFSGLNHVLRRPRLEQLTRSAREYLSGLGDAAPLSEWCGLRPVSADGLPIVGAFPGVDGLHVATGHGMLGLTLAPVTGRIITDLVEGRDPGEAARALAPARFA